MSNEEANSSHHAINIQESSEVKTEPFENLYDRIQKAKDDYKFAPIYVVPTRLREVSPSSFTPRVVSIGPLHKGYKSLKSLENKKVTILTQLLHKTGSPKETFQACMQKMMDSIKRIKGYYFAIDFKHSDLNLALMMLTDGCFILEFINSLSSEDENEFSKNRLRSRNIALDLVMLENQIPYFVLLDIYNYLTVDKNLKRPALHIMLKELLDLIHPFEEPLEDDDENVRDTISTHHFHILDLLHKFYQPINFELPAIKTPPTAHSAVELIKVGVKIMPDKDSDWPMAMKFEYSKSSRNANTLRMPVVRIDNFFEVVLRNLIAYEQYSPVENYVTSYAMAMDMLVATPADIAKLGKSGVIISHLGSNEKAADMISSICKNVNLQDFYYMEPWKNIAQYHNKHWPRQFRVFKRTYIEAPFKAVALIAAVTVFLITVYQFFRVTLH
ncbi:hypothetical protein E3N88_08562 [Mikania micrantha]|uniref:Uncharacterized protein n=1 Tax=Mikania micrantha TaxID=192012 RepID=A0A5N6PIU0_9ASTR|nr:hypothetical protein E3N88_08562 [Mikania micrantha]